MKSEFQAVVMAAGKSSHLSGLTSDTPKALLPIANRPMVWYPLNMLASAGFKEAIVVVSQVEQQQIKAAVERSGLDPGLQLDYFSIRDDEELGTADSLRKLRHKLDRDFLVVGCDLVTDLALHCLADVHRLSDATVTLLLAPALSTSGLSVPGGKANKHIEKELVGLDKSGRRVLFISSEADLDEQISFRKSFFNKVAYLKMQTNLTDVHLYLMKKKVLNILDENKSLTTIRGELIPYLVKRQYQNKKPATDAEHIEGTHLHSDADSDIDELMQEALHRSTDGSANSDVTYICCCAHVVQDNLCLRANSIATYCETNRQVPRKLPNLVADTHTDSQVTKHQVSADSLVGEGCTLGTKYTVNKRSVVGSRCQLGDKTSVSNSIIMDDVKIRDGCQLSGCVVCPEAEIGENCVLTDCIVGPAQKINAGASYKNEALLEDRMMEI